MGAFRFSWVAILIVIGWCVECDTAMGDGSFRSRLGKPAKRRSFYKPKGTMKKFSDIIVHTYGIVILFLLLVACIALVIAFSTFGWGIIFGLTKEQIGLIIALVGCFVVPFLLAWLFRWAFERVFGFERFED